MTFSDYYRILDLEYGSSMEDIKRAYRIKARQYHPDINHDPSAKDKFILVTEAYEFLMTNYSRMVSGEDEFRRAVEDWRKYRQNRSRQKANVYARASYVRFKNTKFYKTTRILDGTTIISSLVFSVMVLITSVYGYFYRINHPIIGIEKPSILILIVFILFGMTLFIVSFIYLKAHIQSSKKHRKK